jgi:hypothetical protein
MNTFKKAVTCQCLGLLLCPFAQAADSDPPGNPYQEIFVANVFGLKPPEVVSPKPTQAALPKVTLTGITTLLPGNRVLLLVQFPPHPPEPGRQERYVLAQGQSAGPIEVQEIDERLGRVKLIVSGEPMWLTFEASASAPSKTGKEL